MQQLYNTNRLSVNEILVTSTGGPFGRRRDEAGHTLKDYARFHDLITRMLDFDPATRLSASEAVRHPFLRQPSATHDEAAAARLSNRVAPPPPHPRLGHIYTSTVAPPNVVQPTSNDLDAPRFSFVDNSNVEELASIQRQVEGHEPGVDGGNAANTLMPIGYYP